MDQDKLDAVVLGCTHFIFFKKHIQGILKDSVRIIDGNEGTCRHLMDILRERNEINDAETKGSVMIYNSSKEDDILELSYELFQKEL